MHALNYQAHAKYCVSETVHLALRPLFRKGVKIQIKYMNKLIQTHLFRLPRVVRPREYATTCCILVNTNDMINDKLIPIQR